MTVYFKLQRTDLCITASLNITLNNWKLKSFFCFFLFCCILQQELEAALRKAKLLYTQRQDEYEKAKSCTARAEEEHLSLSGSFVKDVSKQLEKKRRLEEEALQKVRAFVPCF